MTRVAAGGSPALGTLSVTGYAANPALGTLAVDRTLFLAFANSRVRLTRPDVLINDELMENLVDTVKLDSSLDDPVNYAAFTLSDKRSAFFDPATVSAGAQPVEVDLWAGPPGGVVKWQAFEGLMETCQNTMPYRPRGAFKAVGMASLWANLQGCLSIPAMAGLTRGQIIDKFAQSAGVSIANAAQIGGAIVTKALDLNGTPFDLIQKWGELEGWRARATLDGTGLEIINEDRMLEGAPVFAFDESNTYDVPESTPDRPVTDWILSGTQMALAADSTLGQIVTTVEGAAYVVGVSLDSSTVTEITTDSGVEIKRVVSQYATVAWPGFSIVPDSYQLVSRVTTERTFAPYTYSPPNGGLPIQIPSTQLLKLVTTTETLSGVPECTSGGVPWVQGGSWSQDWAVFLMTGRVTETFAYDTSEGGDPCFCVQDTVVTESYYSPLDAFGIAYPDGSIRHNGYYMWQETARLDTRWNNNSDVNVIGTSAWSGSPTESYVTKYTTGTAVAPVGSSTTPQFSQQVMVAEFDATDASGYSKLTGTETIDFAENIDELDSIARRRIRRACSDQLAIPHNAIPYLREGDHVLVTNHARSLVNVDAYVYSIERTDEVTNAAQRQVTTVNIPPSWI
jgi:hypothetical protein